MIDYKIHLFANNTVYVLDNVDSILSINIDYGKYAAIAVSYKKDNYEKNFQVMFKSPQDDKFIFEQNIDDYNVGSILNELLDINHYLTKDIDNFNKIKRRDESNG